MKNYSLVLMICFSPLFVMGQEKKSPWFSSPNAVTKPLTKKGAMFAFWGWNRALYSNSDIHFKGNGYDFTLDNVVAHDRPSEVTYHNYLQLDRVTIPQTNMRLGYFFKDNQALVLGVDHMKYVMDQDQTVNFSGQISDPTYANMVNNGMVDLSDSKFLTFEHTDGLNYINLGYEKYNSIYTSKNIDFLGAFGGGAGVLLPKTNSKLFGFERSDRFHIAGYGLDARGSINAVFWNHFLVRSEIKAGFIHMPDIKTRVTGFEDKASQAFWFYQLNFGVGYIFQTKKQK